MKKTSKADFNKFKQEFLRWVDVFALKCYRLRFYHTPLKNDYAQIAINESGKLAEMSYSSELDDHTKKAAEGPIADAKHEAIHLLLHRLCFLGQERYTASDEIGDEAEKLVCILEKVL